MLSPRSELQHRAAWTLNIAHPAAGGQLVGLRVSDHGDGQPHRHRGQQHLEQHAHRDGGACHVLPGAQGLAHLPLPGRGLRLRPLRRLHRVRACGEQDATTLHAKMQYVQACGWLTL